MVLLVLEISKIIPCVFHAIFSVKNDLDLFRKNAEKTLHLYRMMFYKQ